VSDYRLDDQAIGFRSPAWAKDFYSSLALEPTQTTVQWVPGVLSPGVKRGRGVTLTTQRMSRSYTSSPPSAFMACRETAYIYIYIYEISSSHGGEYDVQSCLLGYTYKLYSSSLYLIFQTQFFTFRAVNISQHSSFKYPKLP
jgi:hypothetical protein